jgi:capsular exopolysaccharide synthesis family protein
MKEGKNPRDYKMELAREVVKIYYGEKGVKEAEENFDNSIAKVIAESGGEKLVQVQAALERTKKYEDSYREMLAKVDTEAIDVGRKQLTIEDLKEQLALTKERYDQYTRRIQELEIEQKLPARISVAQYADIGLVKDKRIKLSLAIVFAAIALGVLTAFLMFKADHRIWIPDDLTKKIDISIIGTTTAFKNVKKTLLPELVEEDFHTICANLGLFSKNGQEIPKKIVMTSSGVGDGKTTSAINLAISLAKSGKRVLLIDGDLRKPDIDHLLNLPKNLPTMLDLISGESFDKVVCHSAFTNLDVLLADSHNPHDAYKFLSQFKKNGHMENICQRYDHIIIDTPPILAFPDARIWAKMVGSVVLTGLAGRTTGLNLKKAVEQLSQINVKILGMILCNVPADKSYGYGYGYEQMTKKAISRKQTKSKKFLMPTPKLDNDNDKSVL